MADISDLQLKKELDHIIQNIDTIIEKIQTADPTENKPADTSSDPESTS